MNISHPIRVRRSYTQTLVAPPAKVFPLLCPVREAEWVNGWNPSLVLSETGVIELDCIFVMPGQPHESVWVVTQWRPQEYYVEFLKVTPGLAVGRIEIGLRAGEGQQTLAEVSYAYTALSETGERFVEGFTEEHYEAFMQAWETALNHYLLTGEKKPGGQHP